MKIINKLLKILQQSPGAIAVFIVTTAVLLPAMSHALNYDLAWLNWGDETEFHRIFFARATKHGFLAILALGATYNYGWIYWVILGIPMYLLFIPFGWEGGAVFWPRFVSVVAFAASLSLIWIMARKAKIPVFLRLGIVLLMGFMPGFVQPATSFRPEPLLFLVLVISFYFLMDDEGKFGSNWYKSVFTWGVALAVKIPTLFSLPGFAVYYIYFSRKHHQNRSQSYQLAFKSLLLAGAGFIIANFPLLNPKTLQNFISFGQKMNISNQTNHGASMEGLSFWTWFSTSSTYFIWLPWLVLITLMGLIAVRHELREKSERPYATIGLVLFWSTFLCIALVTRKDSSWAYYLIPAFAAFPLVVLGILRWLDLRFSKLYRWLYLFAIIVFTTTQLNLTTSIWWNKVSLESSPKYEIAKGNLEKIKEYVATLPRPSEVKILDQLRVPSPNKIKQKSVIGPSLEENFLNPKKYYPKFHPDLIIIEESFAWNLPINIEIPESSHKKGFEKSRLLFHQAQSEGVKIGDKLFKFRKVPLDLTGLVLFQVVEVN